MAVWCFHTLLGVTQTRGDTKVKEAPGFNSALLILPPSK